MKGYDIEMRDVKDFMEVGSFSKSCRDQWLIDYSKMCAYETVAVGYSAFCPLFTQEEWEGFQHRNDIMWWYTAGFGSPIARAEGVGYAQELIARLTHGESLKASGEFLLVDRNCVSHVMQSP